jgi:hypothetical protein
MKRMSLACVLSLASICTSLLLSAAYADMVVTPLGDVGIGTTSPAGILHANSDSAARVLIEGSSSTQSSIEMFGNGTGNSALASTGNTGYLISV